MTELITVPLAVTFESFTDFGFWTSVGILAGTYTLFTLGLQLNVGYTGVVNFGQAGFMAIGAYTMGILVVKAHWSFWLAMPTAILVAMAFGVLIGLPSLRLRADYFAIATLAAAEIVRITAAKIGSSSSKPSCGFTSVIAPASTPASPARPPARIQV